MNDRRAQIWVGTFLLVATAVLVAVVLSVSGAFTTEGNVYSAYFTYTAGLAPGAPVRYGGLMAGKVETLRVDPQDTTRIQITFRVGRDIPVKTDSLAKITSLGALGEGYLEITTGTKGAPTAPPHSTLSSRELMAISDIGDQMGALAPIAKRVLEALNDRLGDMKVTLARLNDMLGDQNQRHLGASLASLNTMLAETRPKLATIMDNVQAASDKAPEVSKRVLEATARITPLLDDLKTTVRQANEALARIDSMVVENRPDIRATMIEVRKTMETASTAAELAKSALGRNSENVDESLANLRAATDNLKELTENVKRKPSVLIRGETGKDRRPGDAK